MAPPAHSAGVRLLLLRRLLSTATEPAAEAVATPAAAAAAKAGKKGGSLALYRRLSALGRSGEGGSVSWVLNKWVREGGALRVEDLVKHVKELRKYKRHGHALEVHPWIDRPFD